MEELEYSTTTTTQSDEGVGAGVVVVVEEAMMDMQVDYPDRMEVEVANTNKENSDPMIPVLDTTPASSLAPKRKRQPPPRKKDSVTQRKKKSKAPNNRPILANIQPHAASLPNIDGESLPTIEQPDNESTTRAVVSLASLPPSKLCRKINSLENKLVHATERKEDVEKKYADKALECKIVRQELWREKKAGNTLIEEEKEKVAAALKEVQTAKEEAQSAKEEVELNVERLLEEMEKLKLECSEKIHDERRYCKQAKEDLIVKHAKELRGHELIVAKLKEMHENELERLNNGFAKQLQKQKSLLEKETNRADDVTDKLATVDERHAAILREVRALQRDMLKKSYDENEQLRNDIRDLEEMMEELCDENTAAIKQAKVSDKAAAKANDSAQKQRSKMNAILDRLKEVEHSLVDESHLRYEAECRLQNESAPTGNEIERESRVGLRGGSGKWTAKVVLLICELLVGGVAPTAIKNTLQSTSAFFKGKEANKLPQESFIRECRTVVQNVNTMLVAYTLANSPAWIQLFTDGTSRRQTSMQNLIIRFKNSNGEVDNVIVSSCIYAEDETSESVSAAVMDMVCVEII